MSRNLADILVSTSVLTVEQRARAEKTAQQSRCQFREAVVKLGFADEEAITIAISKQLGVPYASRENKILKAEKSQGLDKLVTESYARENMVLPLFLDDTILAVAVTDPEDIMVAENLQVMTGHEIQRFIASKAQILKAIDEFYQGGGSNLIEKSMEGEKGAPAEGEDETMSGEGGGDRVDLDKEVTGGKDAQVINLVNAILKQATSERCSDIHLESFDERVMLRFRIDGTLYERMPPPKGIFGAVVSRLKILSHLDIAERRLPQDGTFSMKVQNRVIDLRISVCPTVYGEKVVMRLLDKGAVELNVDKIGFEPKQKQDFLTAAALPHGLIFLTGPTGSGKTTTLYSVLSTIVTPEKNFMTIEDPVEIKLEGVNQVQVRAPIGLTFSAALRSFLRQDPDVILVGEVRDQETAQVCLRAALTGHLVLSTLHTNDAMSTVVRLIDMGIEPFLLSSSLALAAAQRLVRVVCQSCKKAYNPSGEELEQCLRECHISPPPDPKTLTFYEARGCDKCARTGYSGRKAIYEIFLMNREMREIIYKYGGDLDKLRKVAEKSGMWNLRASGWRKVIAGITTSDEILSITTMD